MNNNQKHCQPLNKHLQRGLMFVDWLWSAVLLTFIYRHKAHLRFYISCMVEHVLQYNFALILYVFGQEVSFERKQQNKQAQYATA